MTGSPLSQLPTSVLGARACEHLGIRAGAEREDGVQESSLEMRSRLRAGGDKARVYVTRGHQCF